jgi:hypothetical protein
MSTFDESIDNLLTGARALVSQHQLASDSTFVAVVRYRSTLQSIAQARRDGATIAECCEALSDALYDLEGLAKHHGIARHDAHSSLKRLGERFLGWKWYGSEPFLPEYVHAKLQASLS